MKRILLTLAALLATNTAFAFDLRCRGVENDYDFNFHWVGTAKMTMDIYLGDGVNDGIPCEDAQGDEPGYFCPVPGWSDDYGGYRVFIGKTAEGWRGTLLHKHYDEHSNTAIVCD